MSDTRQDKETYPKNPRPYLYSSTDAGAITGKLGSLYLYENSHRTDDGFGQPDEKTSVATTRLVVGGVFGGGKDARPE